MAVSLLALVPMALRLASAQSALALVGSESVQGDPRSGRWSGQKLAEFTSRASPSWNIFLDSQSRY